MARHTYHHLRRLDIAREALDLGARRLVVQQITGLSKSELRHVFGACPGLTTNWGGLPSSADKLFHNGVIHLHASDFYNGFHHLIHRGVPPDEAMVVAYRRYQGRHAGDIRLCFDRAFTVVTAVCRLWTTAAPSLKPLRCNACAALFLAPIGASARDQTPCAYCRVAKRLNRHERPVQAREPQHAEDSNRLHLSGAGCTPANAQPACVSPMH